MPLRPRHAYAADIQRGLRGGDLFPPPEFPAQLLRVRVAIQPRSTRFELAGCLRGLQTLVSHVHLSGSPGALLRRGPLRTRRATYIAPGSSKPKGSLATCRSIGLKVAPESSDARNGHGRDGVRRDRPACRLPDGW